jgi:hypothetical protein
VGSNDVEVQVPFLSHEEVKEQIEQIATELAEGPERPFGELLVMEQKGEQEKKAESGSALNETQEAA